VHLIIAGLFTRAAAFVLAGEMAVAYFQMHAPKGFWPILNGASSRCCTASRSCSWPRPAVGDGAWMP